MKTQRDLEKLNENVEVKNIDDSVSISLSPRFAVVLLAMIIVVVVAVFAIKNVRKNRLIISPVFLLLPQIYDNQLLLSLMYSVSSSVCS